MFNLRGTMFHCRRRRPTKTAPALQEICSLIPINKVLLRLHINYKISRNIFLWKKNKHQFCLSNPYEYQESSKIHQISKDKARI